jgi:hypothetical protein
VPEALLIVPITILKDKKTWKNKERNDRIRRRRKGRLLSPFLVCPKKYYSTYYSILLMPWYLKWMMHSVSMFGLQNRTELVLLRIQVLSFIVKNTTLWTIFTDIKLKHFLFHFWTLTI